MRIALFTHSTNPRGGPVHALELAGALQAQGHDATIFASDTEGCGFFRRTNARQLAIPAARCPDLHALVATRVSEIAGYILDRPHEDFDVWHAHDTITANALARVQDHGRIAGFVRTVHHLDSFADRRLDDWQRTGIDRAEELFAVSRRTRDDLARRTGRRAVLTGNGVEPARFTRRPDDTDAPLAARLRLPSAGPTYLALGGIETRKNTTAILEAFLRIQRTYTGARLIVAGGASLLDHSAARAEFFGRLRKAADPDAVILGGIISDGDMPALYRRADALVCVSRMEGFGLCPIEAMSCGTPTIVSAIAPFTEHFAPDETLWADPADIGSIEAAMRAALDPATAARLRALGPQTAARFSWPDLARRHLDLYRAGTPAHA